MSIPETMTIAELSQNINSSSAFTLRQIEDIYRIVAGKPIGEDFKDCEVAVPKESFSVSCSLFSTLNVLSEIADTVHKLKQEIGE